MDTPNNSWGTTRRDIGEKVSVLEHVLRRGGIEDHLFGRKENAVSGHEGVVRGMHRGMTGGIVNLVYRIRLNLNRGKRLTGVML